MADRVLLLLPTTSYRASVFLQAAERLGVEVIVGTDRRQALDDAAPGQVLSLDFSRPRHGVEQVVRYASSRPLVAVIGVEDETSTLAAMAAAELSLPGNSVEAVRAAGDKYETRRAFAAARLRTPGFIRLSIDADAAQAAQQVRYPCVLKPLCLSASRGVMRADDAVSFREAFSRVAGILRLPEVASRYGDTDHLLVEDYLPGDEVALEGLLESGRLRELALFDKPDPLHGPTFEETLYVTPSRLGSVERQAILREAQAGCRALGLIDGPVHAELRVYRGEPWLLEVAPRSIGGLCSRTLRFAGGLSLEELILRHALGRDTSQAIRETMASGVMMIPIPRAGRLTGVRGLDEAQAVPGVEEVVISRHIGAQLLPLPEGNRYLGFIFARSETAAEVEEILGRSHGLLSFEID